MRGRERGEYRARAPMALLRVMDAPGFYAAFPWGGYARSKGATGTRSWRTRSIFPSLSPRIFHAWSFIRPRRRFTEQYTEGLHRSVPARGAVLYTGLSRPCIEHKGPPSTKNMHQRRPPVVATIS